MKKYPNLLSMLIASRLYAARNIESEIVYKSLGLSFSITLTSCFEYEATFNTQKILKADNLDQLEFKIENYLKEVKHEKHKSPFFIRRNDSINL